jgi:hypothetical protein
MIKISPAVTTDQDLTGVKTVQHKGIKQNSGWPHPAAPIQPIRLVNKQSLLQYLPATATTG